MLLLHFTHDGTKYRRRLQQTQSLAPPPSASCMLVRTKFAPGVRGYKFVTKCILEEERGGEKGALPILPAWPWHKTVQITNVALACQFPVPGSSLFSFKINDSSVRLFLVGYVKWLRELDPLLSPPIDLFCLAVSPLGLIPHHGQRRIWR